MKLILASNSPRRKDILTEFGYKFLVVPSDFNESGSFASPEETVKAFAKSKAEEVYDRLIDKNVVVIGADTVVVFNGVTLGKPKDKKDAVRMLKALSDNTHEVVTGYAVISGEKVINGFTKTSVTFNKLDDKIIDEYVATGLPLDKAGSYGIQDGYNLVKEYNGSLNNVIGLPIEDIKPFLDEALKG